MIPPQIFFGVSTIVLLQLSFFYETREKYDTAIAHMVFATITFVLFTISTFVATL